MRETPVRCRFLALRSELLHGRLFVMIKPYSRARGVPKTSCRDECQHFRACPLSSGVAFFSFQGINRLRGAIDRLRCWRHLKLELGGQHGEEGEQEDEVQVRGKEDREEDEEGQPEEVVRLIRRCEFLRQEGRIAKSRRGRSADSARRPRRIAPATIDRKRACRRGSTITRHVGRRQTCSPREPRRKVNILGPFRDSESFAVPRRRVPILGPV